MPRIPVLFLLLSLLTQAPARGAEPPACTGRDLSTDASLKPDWAAHADDLVNGDGLLWTIDKPGLASSYLFGTIHSTAAGPIALASQTRPLVEQSQSFASELGLLDAKKKVDLSAAMLQAALSPDKDTLAEALDAKDAAAVDGYLASKGLPTEFARHLKLWMLAVVVSLPSCESEGQTMGLPEVDEMLAAFAQGRHIPITALESVAEQLNTLSQAPLDLSAVLLKSAARMPSQVEDSYKTLLNLYLQKRPSSAIAILDAVPEITSRERDAEAEFTRLLLSDRNETMIDRAAPLLAKGGAFIAVGALHLVGKGGLVALARQRGYEVAKVW